MTIDRQELQEALTEAENDFFEIWQNGPEVTRWETLPIQVGDQAPPFTLPDADHNPVSLSGADQRQSRHPHVLEALRMWMRSRSCFTPGQRTG